MNPELIRSNLGYSLAETDLGVGRKYRGKVRDSYTLGERRIIVTTDRISAFDRVLGTVPFKGQLLNAITAFWFTGTADIIENHVLAVPDPNALVVRECRTWPVEMIVRGYLTGSLWREYAKGERELYGIRFPDGLRKDQPFEQPIITPTTKAAIGEHDLPLTEQEVLQRGLVPPEVWEEMKRASLALFERGSQVAASNGLLLVDTKYEFGDHHGRLLLMDEIHTPDSSRYWHADGYAGLFATGREQRMLDKENVRQWLLDRGFSGDGPPPALSEEIVMLTVERYAEAHRLLTGREFEPAIGEPIPERLRRNLAAWI